jgi:hypothetical protein
MWTSNDAEKWVKNKPGLYSKKHWSKSLINSVACSPSRKVPGAPLFLLVIHTCNPSYSGSRGQEDRGSKSAQANSSRDPISKTPSHKRAGGWAPVAHLCNPSYSGGRDWEDCSSKPAQANSSQDPISKKPITKKWWWPLMLKSYPCDYIFWLQK